MKQGRMEKRHRVETCILRDIRKEEGQKGTESSKVTEENPRSGVPNLRILDQYLLSDLQQHYIRNKVHNKYNTLELS